MVSIGVPPTWPLIWPLIWPPTWPLTSTRRFRYWNRRASGRDFARSGTGHCSRPGGSTSVPSERSAQPTDCLVRPSLQELPRALDCDVPSTARWPIRGTWPGTKRRTKRFCPGANIFLAIKASEKRDHGRRPTIFDFAGVRGFKLPVARILSATAPPIRAIYGGEQGLASGLLGERKRYWEAKQMPENRVSKDLTRANRALDAANSWLTCAMGSAPTWRSIS
jgi:hypothetical protein